MSRIHTTEDNAAFTVRKMASHFFLDQSVCLLAAVSPLRLLKRQGPSYLTLRRLMSYIYIYMEHPFLMFLDHTQRRTTVGRTPLDE